MEEISLKYYQYSNNVFTVSLFYSQGYEEKYEFKCETM